jgi:hypothetical protein
MKLGTVVLVLIGSLAASSIAYADAYDLKWIARCIEDNANAKVAPDVVSKYCTCMNNKMDSNESRSITQWEKTHPQERAECDRESGWK